ncbi:hypothetical protein SAMN04487983_10144 [Streptomyces sp. yr375]|nr:hypothetical protein SAMN04487983_10144 [Streptomyces sp. yr375]
MPNGRIRSDLRPVHRLITRVRQRGLSWILWLRFELYVNLGRMTLPEE